MRFLYTLLSTAALPAIMIRLWWRGRRLPAYRNRWRQRFGWVTLDRDTRPLVWLHAVSVGETIAAAPLVNWLLERDDLQVLVTTMTPTGSEQVQRLFGQRVFHTYIPYDTPGMMSRFLERTQPSLALIMETELWPNMLRACRRSQVPVLLLNARLSQKSANGYGTFPGFARATLCDLSHVAAQNAEDAERFIQLGLPADRCTVTGNIKFDLSLSDELLSQAADLRRAWQSEGERLIFIAASTHPGEEAQVLDAFARVQQAHPQSLLLLVPRHPDRFEEVAGLVEASGLKWSRRSSGLAPSRDVKILLGDTLGELLLLYGLADIAYVGGSLVPTGGHNLIEPAAWGLPLVTGPHLFNFAEVARLMLAEQALGVVRNSEELAEVLRRLIEDKSGRCRQGAAAKAVAEANRGALARVQNLVEEYLPR